MARRTRWTDPTAVLERDWYYSVAFKRRRSGRLRWVATFMKDVVLACRIAAQRVREYGWKGYREYGVSVTKIMHRGHHAYWEHDDGTPIGRST